MSTPKTVSQVGTVRYCTVKKNYDLTSERKNKYLRAVGCDRWYRVVVLRIQ
jgi:hypothetical protein